MPRDAASDAATVDAPPAVTCTPTAGTTISFRSIAHVSGSAVLATSPPGDRRLFVVEQDGRIGVVEDGQLLATPFLDLTEGVPCSQVGGEAACRARASCVATTTVQGDYVSCRALISGGTGSEQGLLGLAFHPDYATNHQFYVFVTMPNPVTGGDALADAIFQFTATGDVADPASKKLVIAIPDFADTHNAGMIEFGADGYLYASTGDGGQAGDPRRNAQNPASLLGKMLRLDVDHPTNGNAYGIPTDNPFADGTVGAPEVFMLGLRNPWRWSFDRASGDMWIGDVGQGQIEEIDYVPAGQQVGKNFGWSAYEASVCCAQQTDQCIQSPPDQPCDPMGKTFPQIELPHASGWSAVIGGQVYRGPCYPDLVGTYFYADHGGHGLSTATVTDGVVTATDLPGLWPPGPASIHADASGELYMTTTTGAVLHLEAGP